MYRRTLSVLLGGALAAASSAGVAADGQLDPAFGTNGASFIQPDGVQAHEFRTGVSLALPDGKILVGGTRNKIFDNRPDPHMRPVLVRLLPDGSPDTAFGNLDGIAGVHEYPDLVPGTQQQVIEAMQRLADGSVVVAGSADAFGPLSGFVLKVGADGELDATFGNGGIVLIPGTYLHTLAIDGTGRVIAGGEHATPGLDSPILVRLNADGSRDGGFGDNGVLTLATGPASTYISTLALTPAGRLVIAGRIATEFGYDAYVARLEADGTLDATFTGNGLRRFVIPGHAASVTNGIDAFVLDSRGRITLAGYYSAEDGSTAIALGRLNADGTDDTGYGVAATPGWRDVVAGPDGAWGRNISGLALQSDGKLVFSISYAAPGTRQLFMAMRTNPDGVTDASFGNQGMVELDLAPNGIYSDATALMLQAGKVVVTGASARTTGSNLLDFAAVRLDSDLIFADRLGD